MDKIKRALAGPWVPPQFGKAPYLWMLSLCFFLWKYVYIVPGMLELLALVATMCLFVPLYFLSYWGWRRATVLLTTCLLGVAWTPHNYGASTFFIFGCAMCAGIEKPRQAYLSVAAVLLLACAVAPLSDLNFILPTVVVGIPVGLAGVMDAKVRRSRECLLRKQEEVEHLARIAERERISRDLHDLLGHTLSLITLKAELAGKLQARDAQACQREIKDIEHSARHALSEVRAAVTGFRQTGFAHELATARASLAAANVACDAAVEAFTLPAAAENVMSLALREAVTNIVRHARATRCEVRLSLDAGMIVLRIADNGAQLADGARVRDGNGLTGMRERVSALGGQLALRVERGLALEMTLPLGAPA
ncbi:MAG: sensor histidine kinase [Pseudomonadota bacterium]